jgi:hypothetical protein
MRKTKNNRKRTTLAKIRRKLYSKRKGRGIGASRISIRRTPVSAKAVSVETALAEAKRAIAKAEVAAKAEERAEEMAWAATRAAATRQLPRAEATRVSAEARVERAEARAATARETAEKAVAKWKNAVAKETAEKAAAAMALAVAEKAIVEAEAAAEVAARVAARAAVAKAKGWAEAPEVLARPERSHPGTEARIPHKEAWEAEVVMAEVRAAMARKKAEKAVAEWKNLS